VILMAPPAFTDTTETAPGGCSLRSVEPPSTTPLRSSRTPLAALPTHLTALRSKPWPSPGACALLGSKPLKPKVGWFQSLGGWFQWVWVQCFWLGPMGFRGWPASPEKEGRPASPKGLAGCGPGLGVSGKG